MSSSPSRFPTDKLDRRLNWRYPISAALQYQLLKRGGVFQTGVGRTVNISSSGVLFEAEADTALTPGIRIELLVEWPARINEEVELNLWLGGQIVRAVGGLTAMTIAWHEYRTRPSNRFRIFSSGNKTPGVDTSTTVEPPRPPQWPRPGKSLVARASGLG